MLSIFFIISLELFLQVFFKGVSETFRWIAGFPVFFDRHLERMKKGAGILGIPFPGEEAVKEMVVNAILESRINDGYIKVCLLSQGPTVFYGYPKGSSLLVIVREYIRENMPIKAQVASFRRSSQSPVHKLKSLNYMENILAKREAMLHGFDEAIFLNDKGELTEANASNIFWFKEDTLFTPSPECGLLPGVIRGVLIELAKEMGIKVIEGSFDLDSLVHSHGGFVTNSLIGAIAISHLERFELPISKHFDMIKVSLLERLRWVS
jgi:4-amino-4-deoxychorismate lyase